MSDIDLGNDPSIGTSPTADEREQIRAALGLSDFASKSGIETLTNKTLDTTSFSGNTYGQLNMPNQLPSSDTSVLTRGALKTEGFQDYATSISFDTPVVYIGPGGSPNIIDASQAGIATKFLNRAVSTAFYPNPAPAGSFVYMTAFEMPYTNAGSRSVPTSRLAQSRFSMIFDMSTNGIPLGTEFKMLFGVPTPTGADANDLTVRGGYPTNYPTTLHGSFGITFKSDVTPAVNTKRTPVVLQIHDGTTLHEATFQGINDMPSFAIGSFHRFMFSWSGTSLKFYYKNWSVQNAVAGRWKLLGELTPAATIPQYCFGDEFILGTVRTIGTAPAFGSTITIHNVGIIPQVLNPLV